MDDEKSTVPPPDRRGFMKRVAAMIIGTISMLPPLGAGLAVLLDPLRRRSAASLLVPVTSLAALPDDGTPRKFSVVTSTIDNWNKIPETPVGAVYLRKVGPNKVQALNVVCPHAGCFVSYAAERSGYLCPCHNSTFGLDGAIKDAKSPSPRAMDELEVEVRGGSEIWVKFQNYRAGVAKKIPVA